MVAESQDTQAENVDDNDGDEATRRSLVRGIAE